MSIQTTISSAPAKAKEGLLYQAQGSPDGIITAVVDDSNGIKPGRAVIRSSTDDFAGELPAGAGSLGLNVLGVSVFVHKTRVAPSSDDNEIFDDKTPIPLARRRWVWVVFEDAFDPTDSVFVRVTANGGLDQIGGFRTDADSGNAVAWAGGKIMSSGLAGELGLLNVNI